MSEFKDVEGNCINPDQDTKDFILNHTMLRVKDPKKSLDFYTRVKIGRASCRERV